MILMVFHNLNDSDSMQMQRRRLDSCAGAEVT